MRALVRALAFVLLASPAFAANVWTCTRDFRTAPMQAGGPYVAWGKCVWDSGTPTAAGDAVGGAATLAAASNAFCGSPFQFVVDVVLGAIVSPTPSGAKGALPVWDPVAFKVVVYGSNGAAAANLSSPPGALDANSSFRFVAACK